MRAVKNSRNKAIKFRGFMFVVSSDVDDRWDTRVSIFESDMIHGCEYVVTLGRCNLNPVGDTQKVSKG